MLIICKIIKYKDVKQVFCMFFFRLWIWAAKGSATRTRKSIENPDNNPITISQLRNQWKSQISYYSVYCHQPPPSRRITHPNLQTHPDLPKGKEQVTIPIISANELQPPPSLPRRGGTSYSWLFDYQRITINRSNLHLPRWGDAGYSVLLLSYCNRQIMIAKSGNMRSPRKTHCLCSIAYKFKNLEAIILTKLWLFGEYAYLCDVTRDGGLLVKPQTVIRPLKTTLLKNQNPSKP